MESSPVSLNTRSKEVGPDPFQRLSLAVSELDKLINRANQLAHLSEQPFPPDQPTQVDQAAPSQKS
jgi:hypothetical protein